MWSWELMNRNKIFALDSMLPEKETWIAIPNHKDIELMQYTGLKDKQGKEIYEGDVLRMKSFFEGNEYNQYKDSLCRDYIGQVVILASKGTCLKYPTWTDNETAYSGRLAWYKPVSGCNLEVIGNIYESPELLTKGEV